VATKILVPVDNLECTYAALQSIKARDWIDGTEFMLLKVIEDLKRFICTTENLHDDVLAREQDMYTAEVVGWMKFLKADFAKRFSNCIGHIEFGDVPSKIADVAFEWGADHIIIGSHDLDVTTRCALGSVAAKVLEFAPCTVEIIRYKKLRELMNSEGAVSHEELVQIALPPRKILVATDLSTAASAAVDWASDIEWPMVSSIKLLSVVSPEHKEPGAHWFGGIGTVYTKEKHHQRLVEQELKSSAEMMAEKLDLVKVETEMIVSEDAIEEIASRALDWNANLIIMGARGKTDRADVRVGSTVLRILERAHCSVVVVQHDARSQVAYSWRKHSATPLEAESSLI
jgi:nucleotide-binding universal stress UspA family protein